MHVNKKFNEINQLRKNNKEKNELIDFIFFNENKNNTNAISNSLIDIVVSSFSTPDKRSLNYNFLLFYISLGKLIDPENDRAALIKGELFQNLKKDEIAKSIFKSISKNSPYYIEAQKSLAYNYSTFLTFEEAEKEINLF